MIPIRTVVYFNLPQIERTHSELQPQGASWRSEQHANTCDPLNSFGRLEDVYLKNLDMAELIEKARHAVMNKASAVLQDDPSADLRYIVLDMPCSFYSLRTLR